MKPYCANCGTELDESEKTCSGCGSATHDGDATFSYIGSALLYIMALIVVLPMEGYTMWVASSLAYASTATITLPPVKLYLRTEHGFEITRGASWFLSILGVGIALALTPA